MKVYCNPYHALDATGRLAGACPWDPDHKAGAPLFVCAERVRIEAKERDARHRGHPDGDIRERYGFTFTGDPLSVPVEYRRYYVAAAESKCLFAPRDGAPPMAEWRASRAAAIALHVQRFGTPPDMSSWAEQFPLDAEIAAVPARAPRSKDGV